jgi:hypothetical protein
MKDIIAFLKTENCMNYASVLSLLFEESTYRCLSSSHKLNNISTNYFQGNVFKNSIMFRGANGAAMVGTIRRWTYSPDLFIDPRIFFKKDHQKVDEINFFL